MQFFGKNVAPGLIPPVVGKQVVKEFRDVQGFYWGVLVGYRQITAYLRCESPVDGEMWAAVCDEFCADEHVVATCLVTEFGVDDHVSVFWECEPKDRDDHLQRLALSIHEGVERIHSRGATVTPLDRRQLIERGGLWWARHPEETWPPVATKFEEQIPTVTVDGTSYAVFEVAGDDDLIDEVVGQVESSPGITITQFYRPPAAETSGDPKKFALVVLSGSNRPAVQDMASLWMNELGARFRLRVHRAYARQGVMFVAAGGLGILPWNESELRGVK